MSQCNHYLLTRFNLKVSWSKDRSGVAVQTDEWLEHRTDLFARFCLPSVIGQTCQDFRWLIIVDETSSVEFVERLTSMIAGHDHYTIVSTSRDSVMHDIQRIITSETQSKCVVTSRLDNDDILHKGYISTVRDCASTADASTTTVIDLSLGYQLVLNGSSASLLELRDACNAFVSIVEPTANCKTVWSRKHTQWLDSSRIVVDDAGRYWIQVIHETNIANREIKHLRAVSDFDRASFNFQAPIELSVSRFHNLLRPWHYMIEISKRQLRRIWQ